MIESFSNIRDKANLYAFHLQLTDVGRQTTLALGKRTRRLYIERLGFLPPVLDAQSAPALTLRATPIPRALESVQQAFTGLYPPATRAAGGPLPVIVARKLQDETLFPNEGACKRFKELARAFADRAAQLRNSGPELAYINQKIGKWMPTDSPILKVDSHPRLTGVMDTINATDAHGSATKLPEEFYDAKVRAGVDRLCVEEWFAGYQESNEYRRLGIGALMGDLTQRMIERTRANEAESFKMSLAGCHDTTLAASLAALGIFDVRKDKWPNFTSSIAFELFKRKTLEATRSEGAPNGTVSPSTQKIWWSSWFSWPGSREDVPARLPIKDWSDAENRKLNDFYVRLRYNDTPVTIPYCQIAGRHLESDETFCTLSAFKEAADSFTPKSWKEECGLNLGKPAVPTIIEPPPGVRGSKLI